MGFEQQQQRGMEQRPWLVLVGAELCAAGVHAAALAKADKEKKEAEVAVASVNLAGAMLSAAGAYFLYDASRRGKVGYLNNPTTRAAVTAALYMFPSVPVWRPAS